MECTISTAPSHDYFILPVDLIDNNQVFQPDFEMNYYEDFYHGRHFYYFKDEAERDDESEEYRFRRNVMQSVCTIFCKKILGTPTIDGDEVTAFEQRCWNFASIYRNSIEERIITFLSSPKFACVVGMDQLVEYLSNEWFHSNIKGD